MLLNRKEREKVIFDVFRDKYGLTGEFIYGDNPDFLVSENGNTLGIEVTEIYNPVKIEGKTLREHEVMKEMIVERARDKSMAIGLPPLHVNVSFAGNIKNNRVAYLTEVLFEIVKNNCPEQGNLIEFGNEGSIPDDFLSIFISNIPGSKRHVWMPMEVGCVETNFSDQIQQRIDSKAKKLRQYYLKCDRCWLIIAALGVSASNFYEIGKDMEKFCYESPFEKVFFFNEIFNELDIRHTGNKQD